MESKSNIIIDIILIPIFLLKYFLLGLKVLFYDSIKSLFKNDKNNSKKVYSEKTLLNLKGQLAKKLVVNKTDGKTHIYKYIVMDNNGNINEGKMVGDNLQEVYTLLKNDNADVYDVKTSFLIDALYKETNIGGGKISNKNLIFWITQLSTYLKSGLTLNEATKILCTQMKINKTQLQALKKINYELNLGENFSTALEHQKKVFPTLFINMIKAAEASGTLIETLDDMANYYTELDNNHKQMINAITYPMIILIFSIAVIIFIMIYVVPQFEKIYASNNAPITGITSVLINVSNFIKSNIFVILLIVLGVIILFVIGYKFNKDIRKSIQIFAMKLPILKKVIIYNELSIFSSTFASLLKNNVYITDTIDLLGKITSNEVYKDIFASTIKNIVNGEKISDAFKNHWAIPDVAYYMIVTGENTGELQPMMEKVSDYYRAQHKYITNNLKTFLEPILITFLAVIVGVIVISVVIPLFDIYGTIR